MWCAYVECGSSGCCPRSAASLGCTTTAPARFTACARARRSRPDEPMSVAGAPPSIQYDEAPETGESVPGRPAWRDLVLCFAIAVLGALVAGLPPPLSVP